MRPDEFYLRDILIACGLASQVAPTKLVPILADDVRSILQIEYPAFVLRENF